ncbi:MAG: hypothetical protein AB8F74_06930 [Saprospiraceae bacterium]
MKTTYLIFIYALLFGLTSCRGDEFGNGWDVFELEGNPKKITEYSINLINRKKTLKTLEVFFSKDGKIIEESFYSMDSLHPASSYKYKYDNRGLPIEVIAIDGSDTLDIEKYIYVSSSTRQVLSRKFPKLVKKEIWERKRKIRETSRRIDSDAYRLSEFQRNNYRMTSRKDTKFIDLSTNSDDSVRIHRVMSYVYEGLDKFGNWTLRKEYDLRDQIMWRQERNVERDTYFLLSKTRKIEYYD